MDSVSGSGSGVDSAAPFHSLTGTYGASFKVVDNGYRSFTLSSSAVQNGRDYTRYVGGAYDGSGQVRIHQGRWPRIVDAVSRQVDALVQRINQSLSDLFRGEAPGL